MGRLFLKRPSQTRHSERSGPTPFLPRSLLRTRRPAQSRYGFPSSGFCPMNLSSIPLLRLASMRQSSFVLAGLGRGLYLQPANIDDRALLGARIEQRPILFSDVA